jgi:hypothetical protein
VLPSEFKPSLKAVVSKIINYAVNIVMILPANTDIEELGQTFAEELISQQIKI